MARYLVNRLSVLPRLSRMAPVRIFSPTLSQVRQQTTSAMSGENLLRNDRGVASYVGMKTSFSSEMEVCTVVPNDTSLPVYQVLDTEGCIHDSEQLQMSNQEVLGLYKQMLSLTLMDKLLYEAQRHGRITFYMTCTGEEAIHYGSAAALHPEDMVYAQYREAGVIMYRGFSPEDCMNQCMGNSLDMAKARQMPVHYGSKQLNYQQISSPLGTQIPQAPGMAYAFKLQGGNRCVCVYFGDGSASEGDCHAAMNFASTLQCPVIFFCRNNGYAISTPATDQYAGDGIALRAIGYGMEAVRVDGNDLLAVYNAVKHYRARAVKENKPFLIEAMTYRVGHHSTSDDWKAYRYEEEVQAMGLKSCPVKRVKLYLIQQGLWTVGEDEQFIQQYLSNSVPLFDTEKLINQGCVVISILSQFKIVQYYTNKNLTLFVSNASNLRKTRSDLLKTLEKAERQPKPGVVSLFTDVYDKLPQNLEYQQAEVIGQLKKYPNEYPKHYQ